MGFAVGLAATLLLIADGTAMAKARTGSVHGTVTDEEGNPLAGVEVTLEAGAGPRVQVTNAHGELRFDDLPPAKQAKLTFALQGYYTTYQELRIKAGRDTKIEMTMASPDIQVDFFEAFPRLLDEHETVRGVTVTQEELRRMPTARIPWALLPSVPGVQADPIGAGAGDGLRRAAYAGPGSTGANSIWSVDGAVVTDMAAPGGSPATYDFDALEEVQIKTGGADLAIATGGVVLNLVTKHGSSLWRGSARYLNAPSATQSSAGSGRGRQAPDAAGAPNGLERIRGIDDFGGEAGGPVVADHLWLWGAFGDRKTSGFAAGGIPYDAQQATYNGSVTAQIGDANNVTFSAFQNDETVAGRDAGPARPLETAWDQGRGGSRPTFARVQDDQIFSSGAWVAGTFSEVNDGFRLTPIGGAAATPYLDPDGVWHHGFTSYVTNRPQRQGKLDGTTFFMTGLVSHALTLGGSYRRVDTRSLEQWGGVGWILDGAWLDAPAGQNLLYAARAASLDATNTYTSGYAEDAIEYHSLLANAGVRYDLQQGHNNPSTSPANPVLPALLPAYRFRGSGAGFSWQNLAPRLGLTYAVDDNRQTLLRASYSRFADQLGAGAVAFTNPAAVQSYDYFVTPQTGPGTPLVLSPAGTGGNVDPTTRLPFANNAVARNFSAGLTDEGLVSVEHALSSDMVIGLELTYRRLADIADRDLLVFDCSGTGTGCAGDVSAMGRIARRGDYQPVTVTAALPGGRVVPVTYYTLRPGVFTRNGQILVNGDRTQRYQAASLQVTRRLSHCWMLRGHFTIDSWRWGNTGRLPDPTEGPAGGARDGDPVLAASGDGAGPEAYVYIGARWTGSLDALYQVEPDRPWGFDVAANLTARQGYPLPYYISQPLGANGNYAGAPREAVLAAASPASGRLANVYGTDLRIAKELQYRDWALTVAVDCFNAWNASTVLQRVADLGTAQRSAGTAGAVYETVSPRIFRFGARVAFR